MIERAKEDETPISPKANSPAPEIFSSKKIFFLNSSYSGSRRSEIPHIEADYCSRDEVSRRLFHRGNESCDCDCASDGCGGCLRRNKQCFFKFFVLALSIALVLLLFGSLSYNLTRSKDVEDSLEAEDTKWAPHYHEYPAQKNKDFPERKATNSVETGKSVSDLPVPIYKHSEDYDSSEDSSSRFYYNFGEHDRIKPISFPPLDLKDQKENSQDSNIIYDSREPQRIQQFISPGGDRRKRDLFKKKYEWQEKLKKLEKVGEQSFEPVFDELNDLDKGMEEFWNGYFKEKKPVFQPFSLATSFQPTPKQSDEYSVEEEIEDELRNRFLSLSSSTKPHSDTTPKEKTFKGSLDIVASTSPLEWSPVHETEMTVPYENSFTERILRTETMNSGEYEWVTVPASSYSSTEGLQVLFDSSQEDEVSVDSAPTDTVKGISLADAKKIKKERRKYTLLNSRVVGGSSDVRLPTGPDISKPFMNAFETLKTNQQLSFTPSAASQFILPYQMCLFAGSFSGSRPSFQVAQPRTFSFGTPPLIPSILDKNSPVKNPYQVPAQQNFLSFSINNYPNAPSSHQPPQYSGSSGFSFPTQKQFSQFPGPNKQPLFCTYLQPPLFQFPTVPGTADFSHAKCVDCPGKSQKDVTFAKEFIFPSGRETHCSDDQVSCRDGSLCIPLKNWCDNQVHCRDASDEAFCSCRERLTKSRLCDGYIDCPNGEDETVCFNCPKSAFSCDSVVSPQSCIPLSKRCDGVKDCSTGEDEIDCSALFFNVEQNNSYKVAQVSGYLHRNLKGDWFPVCVEIDGNVWAKEACLGELGVFPSSVDVGFAPVAGHYKGPFIIRNEDGTATLQEHCKGHVATFVKCPAMSCGTRIELYNLHKLENNFFLDELETTDFVRTVLGGNKSVTAQSKANSFKIKKLEGGKDSRLKREETGRVVGGRESDPRAWPWAIAVYKNGAFHCGGVVLEESWVLTAAHCMEQYWKHYYEVRGGMLRRFSFSAMEQVRIVSHVIIHENYDTTIMSSDLALLRLQKPFNFNRWVRPACLPALQDGISKFTSGPAPGTRCTAVGWGAIKEQGMDPDQLREVEIPIMSRCKHKEDLVGEEICAGKAEGGKDTCQGDSGGPLLCRDSNSPASWYVAGIVSHGEGCARPGEPGAYTRISIFIDWITANTNDFHLPSIRPLQDCPGFRCHSASKLCIPEKFICNGFTDCLEAEDEKNCAFDSATPNIFNKQYSGELKHFQSEPVKSFNLKKNASKALDFVPPMNYLEKMKNEEEKATKAAGTKEKDLPKEKSKSGQFDNIFGDQEVKQKVKSFRILSDPEDFVRTTTPLPTLLTLTKEGEAATLLDSFLVKTKEKPPVDLENFKVDVPPTTESLPEMLVAENERNFEIFPHGENLDYKQMSTEKINNYCGEEKKAVQTENEKLSIKDGGENKMYAMEKEYDYEINSESNKKVEENETSTNKNIVLMKKGEDEETKNEMVYEHIGVKSIGITTEQDKSECDKDHREENLDNRKPDMGEKNKKKEASKREKDQQNNNGNKNDFGENEKKENETIKDVARKEYDKEIIFNEKDLCKNYFKTEKEKSEEKTIKKETEKENFEQGTEEENIKAETEEENEEENMKEESKEEIEEENMEEESKEENIKEETEEENMTEETTEENIKEETEENNIKKEIEEENLEEETTEETITEDTDEENTKEEIEEENMKQGTEGENIGEEKVSYEEEKGDSISSEDFKTEKYSADLSTTEKYFMSSSQLSTEKIVINSNSAKEYDIYTDILNFENTEEKLKGNFVENKRQTETEFTVPMMLFGTTETNKESFQSETPEKIFSRTEYLEIESAKSTPSHHVILPRETVQEPLKSEQYHTTTYSISLETDRNKTNFDPDTGLFSEYFQCRLIVQSILLNYRCDGFEDCEDGTDEENCTCIQTLLKSNPNLICDGRMDCPDRSDEKNCSLCLENEFRCKISNKCIPKFEKCDGKTDCRFGEDEAKCIALAEGGAASLPPEEEPSLETEGIVVINRNGVWKTKCQEEIPVFAAGDAIGVCSAIGTIGYERFENRSLVPDNCTGFFVSCSKSLVSDIARYKNQNGNYEWPWNAFVYSDGKFVCFAALFESQWLLTSSHCLRDVSLKKNYLIAALGNNMWAEVREGNGANTIRIDGVQIIPESNAALLHLSTVVNQTESVRPLGVPYSFSSDPRKDLCVAVGDQTVLLKISKDCPETYRCYKRVGSVPSGCKSKPWVGVVACQSRFGWYPASVFLEKFGYCGFGDSTFSSLQDHLESLRYALGKKLESYTAPVCSGFRCSNGLCIPESKTCNGVTDCPSSEDESFAFCKSKNHMKECKITELKCGNGRCIPKVLFGDGINDCGDESDEPRNITCVEYLRLTAPERICDGRRNCHDKTDEDYKLCSCKQEKFQCRLSGYCVPNDFICDGQKDCPGAEDEEQCVGRQIVKNQSKTHLEVVQKSYGVWHTMCPSRLTKERSDALCKDLGFKEALFIYERNQTVVAPKLDAFSWVKLNGRTSLALRGDKPFVTLVNLKKTCSFVKCA